MQARNFLTELSAGLVTSLLSLAYCFSYGALIFAGPLQPFLSEGIAAALITAAVVGTLIALTSGFRVSIAGPDSNTAALLAAMMAALAPALAGRPATEALALAFAALALATFISGATTYLIGWRRLGRLVRFVPYPVLAGFLAASGWLMVLGAVRMASGVSPSFATLAEIAQPGPALALAITVCWAGLLWVVAARFKHFMILPIASIGATVATVLVFQWLGFSSEEIQNSGWFFEASAPHHVTLPMLQAEFWKADWGVLLARSGDMAAIAVMTVLSILLNSTGVEQAARTDIDLDRELRVQGIANIASGLLGGFVGYISVSRTLMARGAGGTGRIAGVVVGLVALASLAGGPGLISEFPRFVLSGLLLQIGGSLLWNWGMASRRRLPPLEWLLVPLVVIATASLGILVGFLLGILGGCVIFAFNVSRVDIVERDFGGDEQPSSLMRSSEEMALLGAHGGAVRVLQLGSFIFFGSAYRLQERIVNLVAAHRPRMVILDFSAVTGIDSSAGSGFAKIRDALHSQGIQHSIVGLSAGVRRVMADADRLLPHHANLDEALEHGENLILAGLGLKPSQHRPLLDWFTDALGCADHARDLIDALVPADYVDERYLCRQGDPTDTLLFVESGRVSVIIERQGSAAIRQRVFGANTMMGEMGFFLEAPRTASLRIDQDAVVWALDRPSYRRLSEKRPELVAALLTYTVRVQSERLAYATRQIAALRR